MVSRSKDKSPKSNVHASHARWLAYKDPKGEAHCDGVFFGGKSRWHAEGTAAFVRRNLNPMGASVEKDPTVGSWCVHIRGMDTCREFMEFLNSHEIPVKQHYGAEVVPASERKIEESAAKKSTEKSPKQMKRWVTHAPKSRRHDHPDQDSFVDNDPPSR